MRLHRCARLSFVLAIVVFGLALVVAGCGGGDNANTLRVSVGEPSFIDPTLVIESEGGQVAMALFDCLTQFDATTSALKPDVATSWESNADATVWNFHLKEGTKFHNGREVVAADFKYAWERLCDPKSGAGYAGLLEMIKGYGEFVAGTATELSGVKVVDSYTLEVTMSESFTEFPYVVGVVATAPVPKEEVEKDPTAFSLMPIGNGPFKMAEPWQSGQYIKVVRFGDYSGTKPKIDGILFKIYADAQTAFVDFEAGGLDWVVIPPGLYGTCVEKYGLSDDGYTADPGRQVQNGPELSTYHISINNEDPLFKNVDLRRAVSLAINRQAICDTVWEGTRQPASSCRPGGLPGYEENQWQYSHYDVEAAKAELAKAGYPKGEGMPTIKLSFNSGALQDQIMQLVQADLAKIGIRTEFDMSDGPTYFEKLGKGEYQVGRNGFGVDYPSIDAFIAPLFTSGSPLNVDRYSNSAVDAEMSAARQIIDDGERTKAEQNIVKKIGDDCPDIPIATYAHAAVTSARVHNLTYSPLTVLDFGSCWIAE